ncbi:MAG: DUF4065 domain-containing protein [Deltaproteobacteria bacterium]|nr:DUF4065 domain-containing protein [Deltaproteobacteria bacterium]
MTDEDRPGRIIYSAIAVANWFIERNRTDQRELTHLKLQKLLYFAQGWRLAYYDIPLFEVPIEAWRYGPVVRSIYHALNSRRKNEVITDFIEGYVLQGAAYSILGTSKMSHLDDETEGLMESVWDFYSKKSPWELVSISHAKKSPWDQVSKSFGDSEEAVDSGWSMAFSGRMIPVELMRSYFSSLRGRSKLT